MALRRTVYLGALLGAVVFYWAYREWLSWLILVAIAFLPWLGLLVSLPAMLSCRASVRCVPAVRVGAESAVRWKGRSKLPVGPIRGKLTAVNTLTGETFKLKNGDPLPTGHCGILRVQVKRARVGDYLGLFSLPIRNISVQQVRVRPVKSAPGEMPDLSRYLATSLKPKPGGGFSEHHEMRLYRPGDNLRQVHWKLSAKVGSLMIREAMEAARNRFLVTLELRGDPAALDEKLGRLLWISEYLAERDLYHHVQCLTGTGMVTCVVRTTADAVAAVDRLLGCSPASGNGEPEYMDAPWRYHIGGDGHEE